MQKFIVAGILAVLLLVGSVWWSNRTSATDTSLISKNGFHWHSTLRIVIDGKEELLPPNIGLLGGHNPVHTHDSDGIIHLEFEGPVYKKDLLLEEFFRLWGKEFTSTNVLGHTGRITMRVNGQENNEFGLYQLQDGDSIDVIVESQ